MTKSIEELRALLAAATSGPWEGGSYGIDGGEYGCDEVVALETQGLPHMTHETLKLSEADAALISAAPTAIADLCDRLKAAEAKVERLRAELTEAYEACDLMEGGDE